uniref:Putative 3-oxoacyl-(Acyl-carrier protein) reductase n=1 Tax=Trypanosoma congolense (strain IL3000) TaxID=1068625 RepID=G0UJK1_TRYCI|nr:putative 3-oxoacyl-(acyl-carrier protein) reductase [Trypanosoma congolense IL3000]
MPWNLDGRVGVVLGVSSAIGKELTARLVNVHQMRLACVSRSDVSSSVPSGCAVLKADLTASSECDAVMKKIKELVGPVSLLVNCAGVTLNKVHVRCTDEEYDALMDVNVRGALQVTRSALRYGGMLQEMDGCVVHIGSLVGLMGNGGQVIYSASKAALSGAVKSWAREYGSKNIRFNVIAPALIEGEGMAETISDRQVEEWQRRCPLGRLATVEDVVDAIIGTVRCRYINGQTINVDGGMY